MLQFGSDGQYEQNGLLFWGGGILGLFSQFLKLPFFHCLHISNEPMWPFYHGARLREDIMVLIKFWQAMLADKKYMKSFMASTSDSVRMYRAGSSSSQYSSTGYLQVIQNNITCPEFTYR